MGGRQMFLSYTDMAGAIADGYVTITINAGLGSANEFTTLDEPMVSTLLLGVTG